MKQSVEKKENTSFVNDVLKLVTGTVAAQALTIAAAPILVRLYSPEAFGTLALFIAITTIISRISCLRYELAINLPKCDKEAANLFVLSIGIAITTSILTIPIFWFGQSTLIALFKIHNIQNYLWLVPPTVLFSGIFLALNFWNSRTKHYGRLSLTKFFRSLTTVGGQLGTGYAGYTMAGAGLIGSSFAGSAVSSLALGYTVWRKDGSFLRQNVSWTAMKEGLKRYSKFPIYNTWVTLLNTVSWQLPVFILGIFFSAKIVGYYALGYRLISIPMNLIGQSCRQVFFQRASEANANGQIGTIVEGSLYYLSVLSVFPTLILLLSGEDIFRVFFGNSWSEAGIYVQILSIWLLSWFISSPIATVFSIIERQEISLYMQILMFGSRIFPLLLGGVIGNARITLVLFSILGFFACGYITFLVLKVSNVSIKKSFRFYYKIFISCMPGGIILALLKIASVSSVIIVIADAILIGIYILIARRKFQKTSFALN